MVNSRRKGAEGELAWVNELKAHGYEAERTQQHKGARDSFDVVSNGPVQRWEVKRRQKFNLHQAVEQARSEADGKIFAVAHRKNGARWLVTFDAEAFFAMLGAGE